MKNNSGKAKLVKRVQKVIEEKKQEAEDRLLTIHQGSIIAAFDSLEAKIDGFQYNHPLDSELRDKLFKLETSLYYISSREARSNTIKELFSIAPWYIKKWLVKQL